MTTELVHQPATSQATSVYDRVTDPLEFVEKMGKVLAHSGACGCETEAQGKLVALACLCEKKSPFEIDRRYHLIQGKLSMKSDVMLAELRRRGGKHQWLKDGTDGKEAVLQLTYDGQTYTSRYTLKEAEQAKLVKSGGGWTKNPANMLRARAVSNGVRMIAPEIAAGIYTPEEREDIAADNGAAVPPVQRSPEEVAARREELQAMQEDAAALTPPAVADVAEKQPATVEQPPETTEATEAAAKIVAEIDEALGHVAMTREQFEEKLKASNPDFTTIEALSPDAAGRLLANLHARIADMATEATEKK